MLADSVKVLEIHTLNLIDQGKLAKGNLNLNLSQVDVVELVKEISSLQS